MTGKFHSHITIETPDRAAAERAARLIQGKVTVIDLGRDDRRQTDRMITNHFVTGYHGLRDHNDVLRRVKGAAVQLLITGNNVVRVKLEHELLDRRSPVDCIQESLATDYTEVHIKCLVSADRRDSLVAAAHEFGWSYSSNPDAISNRGVVQFVTRRFADPRRTIDQIYQEAACLQIRLMTDYQAEAEVHYESVVYDSNPDYDKWWVG